MLALYCSTFASLASDLSVYVNNIGFPKKHHDIIYTLVITQNINTPDGSYEVHWDSGGTDDFSVTANTVSGFAYDLTPRTYTYEVSRSYNGQTIDGPGKNGAIFYKDYSTDPLTLVPAGNWVGEHGTIEVIEWPASDTEGLSTETSDTVYQTLTIQIGALPPPPEEPPEGSEHYEGEWQENETGDAWEWSEYIKDQDNPPINPGGPGAGNWEWSEVLGEGYQWVWNGSHYSDNAQWTSGGSIAPTPYDPDPLGSGVTATSFSDLSGDDLQTALASETSHQLHTINQDNQDNSAEIVQAINNLKDSNASEIQDIEDILTDGSGIQDLNLPDQDPGTWDIDDGTAAENALATEISARTSLANDLSTIPALVTSFGSFFTLQSISLPQTSLISVDLPALGEFYGGGTVQLDFSDFSFLASIRALLVWIVYAMVVLASGKILLGMFA